MKTYRGHIALDRELSFNQARQVLEYCKSHGDQLTISSDGRSIVVVPDTWVGPPAEIPQRLETAIYGLLKNVLIPLGLKPCGVIGVHGMTDTYEIVTIKNMVKLYKNGQITTVDPTKT